MNIKKSMCLTLFSTALCVLMQTSVHAQEPVWDGNTVILQSQKLAPGVFASYPKDAELLAKQGKPVATSGGFIVGTKGVLMIETMLNKRLNQQAYDLIRRQSQKPIIYAVNTSAHGDHSYGNMYLPKGAKIVQHENTQKYIREHFKADTEFMMKNFGKGRGIEEIKPVDAAILVKAGETKVIDLGDKKVQLIDFGFAQTGGDLFVWEPQSKVLWTGNAIIAPKPALPWLLDGHLVETLNTIQKVYDFLPADARVIPGHGPVMGKNDIKWHIDYLAAIKSRVQVAVDKGLTLEQTVAQVDMSDFRGYALFDWVNPNLNVPAAYKDLSALKKP